MEPEEKEAIDNGWKIINIIWITMLVSLFLYLLFPLFFKGHLQTIAGEELSVGTMKKAFLVVSIITLFLTRWIRHRLLSGKPEHTVFYTKKGAIHPHPVVSKYILAIIVSLAMNQSIGLYGLVLFFIGGNNHDLILFIIISAVAMVYYRPRKEELAGLL